MKRIALLILAAPIISHADDPFACVDPDVARAFLGNWYQGRPQYSTSIPDDFFDLAVPASLSLVGSEATGALTTVVYTTRISNATTTTRGDDVPRR